MNLVPPQAEPARGAWRIVIEVRRIDVAVAVSVLLHAILFAMPGPRPPPPSPPAASERMDVVLVTPPQQAVTPPEPVPERRPVDRPQPKTAPRQVAPTRPAPISPQPETTPTPAPIPAPQEAPPVDMMAAVEARRAARRAAEGPRTPPASPPPAEDAATRNLRTLAGGGEGVGGVFEVLHKGTRTGEFAFNGWRPELRNKWRVVIEVDAGQGGDIERAMVRRMIQLIREYYAGDFKWESHRLQRVVTLSARPEDQAGLEDFLMKEFFETPGVRAGR